jgi:hypothetical protein
MKKQLLLVGLLVLVLVLAMAVPALAKSGDAQGKLVLNITVKLVNGVSTSPFGNWALEDQNRHIQVWQTGPESFYLIASWEGKWRTFAGLPSPGTGTAQGDGGSGTLNGCIAGAFTASSVNPNHLRDRGDIGTIDLGATKDNLVPTQSFNGVLLYFPDYVPPLLDEMNVTYRYGNQTWIKCIPTPSIPTGYWGDILIP